MLEAAAEFLREVKQQSQNTRKRRSPTSSHQAGCHRPRRQPVGWEAAARLLRGVKRQSRNTRKRGRARGDGKLDATGPDAKLETDTRKAATPEEQLVGKLQRDFWGGSSGSLGTLEKEAMPQETASWMPQAQTPSWRRTQGKRLRQKNSWLGSCSGTFEGGQAAVSED